MTEKHAKLAQSAPTVPAVTQQFRKTGIHVPASSATIPSVYNKKLNNLFRGRLVVLPGDFTVEEALLMLGKHNVSSAPVIKGKKDNTILGMVGTLDFLAYLFDLVGTKRNDNEAIKSSIENFKKTKINQLIDTSGRNPLTLMNGEQSLADAVDQYLKGMHRIAITDENDELTGIVSQWTIANYLATVPTDDKEWIPSLQASLKETKFTKEWVSANRNDITLDCFFKMHQNNLTALPILDENGKLWGNLSASDLRCFQLYLESFQDLLQPVSQFLTSLRKQQGRKENFVVSVTPDTLVKEVVTKMNNEIIHRVYITDRDNKLLGVFSLTDLLQDLVVDTHMTPTYAKPFTAQ